MLSSANCRFSFSFVFPRLRGPADRWAFGPEREVGVECGTGRHEVLTFPESLV
jgi:hypothetical protein